MIVLKLKWGIYLSTVAGFLTMLLLPDYSPAAVGVFLFVLIPSWFISRNTEPFAGYTRAWNFTSVLFILFTLVLFLFGIKPTHVIFAYQIGFLQISKAFNPKKSRDVLLMWILAFLMIVITAVLTRNPLFPFFLFIFIILSMYTLIWLNVQFEAEKVWESRRKSPLLSTLLAPNLQQDTLKDLDGFLKEKGLPSSWRRTMTLSSVLVVFLSLLIFLMIPRLSPKYYYPNQSIPSPSEQTVFSGFSTEINLGCLRNIQNNPQPVMDVKISDKGITVDNLYLRGGTFDLFTGTSWVKSQNLRNYNLYTINPNNRFIRLSSVTWDTTPDFKSTGIRAPKIIKQEISYRDFPSRYIFSLPNLVMLTSMSGFADTLFKDNGDTVFILPPKLVTQYEAYSLSSPLPDEEESSVLSNPFLTYIPKSLDVERLADLASGVTGKSSSTFEKARRIESYLLNDYQYSLRVGSLRNDNPVEDFLFSTKAGHCELFASSMVMLLRTQEIPCRLAFGFHGGDYDEGGSKFIIRQSNAHTWVEVYDKDNGWVRFDPTPSAPMTIYADRLYFKKFVDFFAILSQKWEDFTFGYNNRQQVILAQKFYDYMKKKIGMILNPFIVQIKKSRAMQRFWMNLRHPFIVSLGIFLLIFNIFIISLYRRFRHKNIIKAYSSFLPPFRKMGSIFYNRMIKLIAGKTMQRPSNLTAREFVFALGREFQVPDYLLEEGSRLYYALRYGPEKRIPQLSIQMQDFLNQLKDSAKKR